MKRIGLAVVLAVALLGSGGCGGGGQHVAYRPAAFGVPGQCYYVNSPAEAISLQAAGLCEPGWAPTIMPMAWHSMYYPYYSSPSYYRTYVPAASRTVYAQSEKSWGSSNKSSIATEAKKATYQGSNGKTVTADKIGATKYGAGNRFGDPKTKFGGGSRNATNPAPTVTPPSVSAKTPQSPSAPSKPSTKASGGGSSGGTKATPSKPASPSKPSSGSKSGGIKSGGSSRPSGGSKPSGGFGGGSRGSGGYGGGSRGYGGGRR
jgi:hypothetical protein